MTEQELKDKIVDVIIESEHKGESQRISGEKMKLYTRIAVSLIAAGLTFDKTRAILAERTNGKTLIHKAQYYDQMKHRAEVAEKAARDLITYYCGYTIENDIDSSLRVALQQAEKALQEEGKE